MRAPQDGIVHQSTVHTIGGVMSPAEQIMLIVPETEGLVVEARIEPAMIDRPHIGQAVALRFPAFDSRATPDLEGRLIQVSADTSTDEKTGASFYTARIGLGQAEVKRLDGETLLPGSRPRSSSRPACAPPLFISLSRSRTGSSDRSDTIEANFDQSSPLVSIIPVGTAGRRAPTASAPIRAQMNARNRACARQSAVND